MAGNIILLLGPSGAGKSKQAARLAKRLPGTHISTGAMLRESGDVALQQIMEKGKLVPSADVQRLLEERIFQIQTALPVILDGFPRLLDEAEWLAAAEGRLGLRVVRTVLIQISRSEAEARIMARGRHDDTLEALRQKWREYQEETQPVVEYYDQLGLLCRVNGEGGVDEVTERIITCL